jgi:hypothetical protein
VAAGCVSETVTSPGVRTHLSISMFRAPGQPDRERDAGQRAAPTLARSLSIDLSPSVAATPRGRESTVDISALPSSPPHPETIGVPRRTQACKRWWLI